MLPRMATSLAIGVECAFLVPQSALETQGRSKWYPGMRALAAALRGILKLAWQRYAGEAPGLTVAD